MGKKNKLKQRNLKNKSEDKKLAYFKKNMYKFNSGTLKRIQLPKLSNKKQIEYLQKELNKKYKAELRWTCHHCATSLLFDDAAVSDDELIDTCSSAKRK